MRKTSIANCCFKGEARIVFLVQPEKKSMLIVDYITQRVGCIIFVQVGFRLKSSSIQ